MRLGCSSSHSHPGPLSDFLIFPVKYISHHFPQKQMMEEGWLVYFCLQSRSWSDFCTHTPSPHLTKLGRRWRNPARSAGRCSLFCSDWSKNPAAAVQASMICSHRNTNVFTLWFSLPTTEDVHAAAQRGQFSADQSASYRLSRPPVPHHQQFNCSVPKRSCQKVPFILFNSTNGDKFLTFQTKLLVERPLGYQDCWRRNGFGMSQRGALVGWIVIWLSEPPPSGEL